jgi:hypothetical protein
VELALPFRLFKNKPHFEPFEPPPKARLDERIALVNLLILAPPGSVVPLRTRAPALAEAEIASASADPPAGAAAS